MFSKIVKNDDDSSILHMSFRKYLLGIEREVRFINMRLHSLLNNISETEKESDKDVEKNPLCGIRICTE